MRNLPHFRLEGTERAEDYLYTGVGGSGTFDRPKRNQPTHAKKLRQDLRGIDGAVKSQRAKEVATHPDLVEYRSDGVVLTFRSDPNHELSVDKLERDGAKIELLGVKVEEGVQIARVFVPDGKLKEFLKLIDSYTASVEITYMGELKDQEKLEALADPDIDIKLRKPIRLAKPYELMKLELGSTPMIKLKFIVPNDEVEGFKNKVGNLAMLLSEARPNQMLVDSIASIRLAIIEDFWQDTVDFPEPNEEIWWEFWLRGKRGTANTVHERFIQVAAAVGIAQVSKLYVAFPERVVVHAKATPRQISSSIDLLAMIGELRKAKELASYYVDMEAAEQAYFVDDLSKRLVLPGGNAPSVCILDWGVNRSHPLLKPALSEDDQHASQPEWGVSDSDKRQHGTGMAGLALYGCLTDVLKEIGEVKLRHILESVKIMPPPPAINDPPDYGRRMQDGVALAHIQAAKRNRALCMAVTTSDHRDGGVPSLWSGAVDDLCSGAFDGAQRLMFISAGNMREEIRQKDFVYHDWNIKRGGVEDPGQAWNALTVGAFTEKVEIRDKTLAGYEPLAPTGGLCPTSRTSLAWPEKQRDGWPIKPDLVLEGGNYAVKDGLALSCDDLSLLSTIMKHGRLLTTMLDTSPATALAARMAATIWSHHPDFWPETVRALMVHTARWTPAMKAEFPTSKKSDILKRLRCYGYGVPNLQRALHSAQNAVTMIYQGELQPFRMEKSKVKTNHMNVHDLPWPAEVLANLGEEQITMRVTLSYFVEPSPGNVGWGVNHRYASHGLRFDVIRPTESLDSFMKRISQAFWDGPKVRPKNAKETRGWVVGEGGRSLGCLHSDWWTGTAATLARSGKLVVYPVSGWWRERKHLERFNQSARYSLLISIRSAKQSIDLYTPIIEVGAIQTEVIE